MLDNYITVIIGLFYFANFNSVVCVCVFTVFHLTNIRAHVGYILLFSQWGPEILSFKKEITVIQKVDLKGSLDATCTFTRCLN